jgi:hypothetical protein
VLGNKISTQGKKEVCGGDKKEINKGKESEERKVYK